MIMLNVENELFVKSKMNIFKAVPNYGIDFVEFRKIAPMIMNVAIFV